MEKYKLEVFTNSNTNDLYEFEQAEDLLKAVKDAKADCEEPRIPDYIQTIGYRVIMDGEELFRAGSTWKEEKERKCVLLQENGMREITPDLTVYVDVDAIVTTLIKYNILYMTEGEPYTEGYRECLDDLEILKKTEISINTVWLDKPLLIKALIKLSTMDYCKSAGYRDCLENLQILPDL